MIKLLPENKYKDLKNKLLLKDIQSLNHLKIINSIKIFKSSKLLDNIKINLKSNKDKFYS